MGKLEKTPRQLVQARQMIQGLSSCDSSIRTYKVQVSNYIEPLWLFVNPYRRIYHFVLIPT